MLGQSRLRLAVQISLRQIDAKPTLAIWAYVAKRPRLYHFITALKIRELALFGGKSKKFKYVPGLSGWTKPRDFPAPEGVTFMSAWKKRR